MNSGADVFGVFLVFGVVVFGIWIMGCINQLRKSVERDSSKVQALLTEIRDKLGK
jgi:hypothetical protein